MKHIVILGTAYPFRGGGLATFNERLARALIDDGHKITIHTFSLQYPSFLFPGKTQYSEESAPEGLDIQVSINSINPFNWFKLGFQLRRQRPDVVIVRYWIPFMAPSLGTICRIIKGNNHTKVIAIVDNILPHEKRPGDKILSRYFVGSVHSFITMSASVMEDLNKFDKSKPRLLTVHPLYDNFGKTFPMAESKAKLELDNSINYILFFGFIRDYKGLDLLLKAMADNRLKELNVKLILAGEYYSDPVPYLKIIKDLSIEDRVVSRTDFIPNEMVAHYFCASDIVVQPYKSATQSGVTQIAYHFNKPMIVTNVGGLPEMVPHNKVGYVVEPEPQEIADALYDFYVNKRGDSFISNVKKEKLKYSWDTMVNAIKQLSQ